MMKYTDDPFDYSSKYPDALPPGTILNDRYLLMDVLGQGGYGITYLAQDKQDKNHRFFAIKEFFHKDQCRREGCTMKFDTQVKAADEVLTGLKYFQQEAETLRRITVDNKKLSLLDNISFQQQLLAQANFNIVKVFSTFDANETSYFVMEYLEGGNLLRMIDGKPIPEAQAMSIITPIAWAVHRLHENSILHMDIKPENIVLRQAVGDGVVLEPVLIDFGTTLHYDKRKKLTTHSIRKAFGTDGYCSAEHMLPQRFAPHLDVYSLGATLLHMLTGQWPRKYDQIHQDLDELLDNAQVTEKTKEAVKHALAYNVANRTSSVEAFIKELAPPFLPNGYVLESPEGDRFGILSVEGQKEDFITYKAERILDDATVKPGKTRRLGGDNNNVREYTIQESFAQRLCRRDEGLNVSCSSHTWTHKDFLAHASVATGLIEAGVVKGKDDNPMAELFEANGTWYSVKRADFDNRRLQRINRVKSFVKRLRWPLVAFVVVTVALWGYKKHLLFGEQFSQTPDNVVAISQPTVIPGDTIANADVKTSYETIVQPKDTAEEVSKPKGEEKVILPSQDERFTKANKASDFKELEKLANEGFSKAYYPLAKYCQKKNKIEHARNWANKAIQAGLNIKQARDLIEEIDSNAKYAKLLSEGNKSYDQWISSSKKNAQARIRAIADYKDYLDRNSSAVVELRLKELKEYNPYENY
ncbi:MAG: serine/threonine protein kinase [Muribaculaceae bacterium]|nr:serine/threonine protein kinase [Muribaculaceae bacterium]